MVLLPSRIRVNFLVAYSEYEKQTHITNQEGGDRVLARRRELIDSATQMMVADELYDGKPVFDLSGEDLMQGVRRFAGVDILLTSDDDFCRQLFQVLKMDATCRYIEGCLCENVPCGINLLTACSRRWRCPTVGSTR